MQLSEIKILCKDNKDCLAITLPHRLTLSLKYSKGHSELNSSTFKHMA